MSYQPQFNGWDKLTLADLLVAYRKAKADCFLRTVFRRLLILPNSNKIYWVT